MSTSANLAQALIGLIVVLGLIGAMAFVARRFSLGNGRPGNILKTITAVSVGTRERVVVLELGDKWLVVGVTPGSVSALHVTQRIDVAPGDQPATLPQAGQTATLFSRILAVTAGRKEVSK